VPAFEVASIKPAAPQPAGMMRVRFGGDVGRIAYENVSLRDLLARAYNVKNYQISGPDWLANERYDVNAKIPENTPTEQVPQMLQTLLTERFKMTIRRDQKDFPIYALAVGKDGPKLKESAGLDPAKLPGGPDGRTGDVKVPRPAAPQGGSEKMAMEFRVQAGGGGGKSGGGFLRMSDGGHMEAVNMSMSGLANYLSNMTGRPVLDMTELKGNYDFTLEVDPGEGMPMMKMGMRPGGGEGGPGAQGDGGPAPSSSPGGSVFSAVQKLGLKLEGRKAPLEVIVIEHADKTPTEN